MVAWSEVVEAEPEFAAHVRARFATHKHKTIATLRKDGSPRISGIEAEFHDELTFGSMPGARKALDLRRDPRFALHGPSVDTEEGAESQWGGDAKIAGLAVELTEDAEIERTLRERGADPERFGDSHFFRADIQEVVLTRVGEPADHLVIEIWKPDTGLRTVRRG